MERIDLYRLYELGSDIHPITFWSPDNTPKGSTLIPLVNALRAVRTLLGPESPLAIDFSKSHAAKLEAALVELDESIFRDAHGQFTYPSDSGAPVFPWMVRGLQDAVRGFEAVLRAEMERAATYRVPKRGTYDLAALVDNAEETFHPDLMPFINAMARAEYQAAGRCFAFGLFTAAGYHSCRAVEAVLRAYYQFFTAKADKGTEAWGELIASLEKVGGVSVPEPKTLDHLRHVKDYDRNPLSHLRAVLDEKDADILLAGAKVAITAMAMELASKSPAHPTLEFVSGNGTTT